MGTLFRITVWTDRDPGVAIRAAFARVAELDDRLSDYKPDSELNRLCRAGGGEPGDDLLALLKASDRLARETDGAFDVTQGPVVRLWREARKSKRLPEPVALMNAADRSGYQNLVIEGKRVQLLLPGMQLDLGGIAKGYAADAALDVLKRAGFGAALVAASGDLAMGDAPPEQAGWRVGIDSFLAPKGEFARVLTLRNCAVSTAGDTEQFVEIDGARYSHIINPHTHRPLTNRIGVTVVAGKGIEADGLDTTLCVLGVARGLELLRRYQGASAIFSSNRGYVPTGRFL